MKNYTFHFEIQTLIEQFIEAFNDVVIKRYNKDKELIEGSDINVKYIYAPKQRIIETLTNPAPGGITLPAVAVNMTSIRRDNERIVNKINGYNLPYTFSGEFDVTRYLKHIPSPVPINIGINMNIFTKYQSDMDQIISNFLPYCDPYIIISWRMPIPENEQNVYELRTEILFNNDIQLTYPDTLAGNQLFRCSASCSFVIKGWVFKAQEDNLPRIFYIDTQLTPVGRPVQVQDVKYSTLKAIEEYYETAEPAISTVYPSITAAPEIRTSDMWAVKPLCCDEELAQPTQEFNFVGSGFSSINGLYLSANFPLTGAENVTPFAHSPSLSAEYPTFNGLLISEDFYEVTSDKLLTFNLPLSSLGTHSGFIDVIITNDAGYGSLIQNYNSNQVNFASTLNISLEDLAMPSTSGIQIF